MYELSFRQVSVENIFFLLYNFVSTKENHIDLCTSYLASVSEITTVWVILTGNNRSLSKNTRLDILTTLS